MVAGLFKMRVPDFAFRQLASLVSLDLTQATMFLRVGSRHDTPTIFEIDKCVLPQYVPVYDSGHKHPACHNERLLGDGGGPEPVLLGLARLRLDLLASYNDGPNILRSSRKLSCPIRRTQQLYVGQISYIADCLEPFVHQSPTHSRRQTKLFDWRFIRESSGQVYSQRPALTGPNKETASAAPGGYAEAGSMSPADGKPK
ncbi:hypothetical protein ABIB81_001874 [Bradyrhizobium sp. I1.7.5]